MVPQITATAHAASVTGEPANRGASRATAASATAAMSRTPRSGNHQAGALARSSSVNATTMGAASSVAARSAVRWSAASSVWYSGSVTDSRASRHLSSDTIRGGLVGVNRAHGGRV